MTNPARLPVRPSQPTPACPLANSGQYLHCKQEGDSVYKTILQGCNKTGYISRLILVLSVHTLLHEFEFIHTLADI